MTISLPPGVVHLWFCFNDDISTAQLQVYRDNLLNPAERARELRFHFERDRKQFVITRALVRTTLSRYVNEVLPAEWQFVAGSHGRPEIVQAAGAAISFNLSHTAGLVVLAVSSPGQLGVDVENVALRPAPLEIAGHYFSALETAALHNLPAEKQGARFFHYWTLKEAYIKAKSQGLSIPLADFGFRLPGGDAAMPTNPDSNPASIQDMGEAAGQGTRTGDVQIEFFKPIEADPAHWQFALLQASPQHVVSVGLHQLQPLQLRMHKIRPLLDEENFHPLLLRQTTIAG